MTAWPLTAQRRLLRSKLRRAAPSGSQANSNAARQWHFRGHLWLTGPGTKPGVVSTRSSRWRPGASRVRLSPRHSTDSGPGRRPGGLRLVAACSRSGQVRSGRARLVARPRSRQQPPAAAPRPHGRGGRNHPTPGRVRSYAGRSLRRQLARAREQPEPPRLRQLGFRLRQLDVFRKGPPPLIGLGSEIAVEAALGRPPGQGACRRLRTNMVSLSLR